MTFEAPQPKRLRRPTRNGADCGRRRLSSERPLADRVARPQRADPAAAARTPAAQLAALDDIEELAVAALADEERPRRNVHGQKLAGDPVELRILEAGEMHVPLQSLENYSALDF